MTGTRRIVGIVLSRHILILWPNDAGLWEWRWELRPERLDAP